MSRQAGLLSQETQPTPGRGVPGLQSHGRMTPCFLVPSPQEGECTRCHLHGSGPEGALADRGRPRRGTHPASALCGGKGRRQCVCLPKSARIRVCLCVCVCTHAHAQRSGTRVVKEQPSDCWGADGPDRVGIGADSVALRAGRGVGALGGGGRGAAAELNLDPQSTWPVLCFTFCLFPLLG